MHLNRAVAVGQAFGPEAGLEVLDTLEGELDGHHLRWAVEADLHRRSDARERAVACYRRALACAPNAAERRFLQMRIGELEAP